MIETDTRTKDGKQAKSFSISETVNRQTVLNGAYHAPTVARFIDRKLSKKLGSLREHPSVRLTCEELSPRSTCQNLSF